MNNTNSIVRWTVLTLVLAACSPDAIVTAPLVDDGEVTVVAKKPGADPSFPTEECVDFTGACVEFGTDQRFRHWAFYPGEDGESGVVRECGVNALERNRVPRRLTKTGQQLRVNEFDAIVMIRELDTDMGEAVNVEEGDPEPLWRVTHIGRARWTARLWWLADGLTSSSWNSHVSGLVAPWPDENGREVEDAGLNLVYSAEGRPGADLEKPDMEPGSAFDMAVSAYLNETPSAELVQVTCKLNANFNFALPWVTVNDVDLDPKPAKGLFHLLDN